LLGDALTLQQLRYTAQKKKKQKKKKEEEGRRRSISRQKLNKEAPQ
jgi:hypothetical protein